jgi:hypothetical protein
MSVSGSLRYPLRSRTARATNDVRYDMNYEQSGDLGILYYACASTTPMEGSTTSASSLYARSTSTCSLTTSDSCTLNDAPNIDTPKFRKRMPSNAGTDNSVSGTCSVAEGCVSTLALSSNGTLACVEALLRPRFAGYVSYLYRIVFLIVAVAVVTYVGELQDLGKNIVIYMYVYIYIYEQLDKSNTCICCGDVVLSCGPSIAKLNVSWIWIWRK